MAKTKRKVTKIKVGDCIGTPGDGKNRTVWGRVDGIDRPAATIISFSSRDWVSPSSKKYGREFGYYTARITESLPVSDRMCGRRQEAQIASS